MQVPLAGRAVGLDDARPRRTAEDRLPVVRGQLARRALAVAEEVARALAAARRGGQRLLEPHVLVGGVVRHQIDDEPDAAAMRLGEHHVEVGQGAEERVDVAVVRDVVAGILLRRALERAQPDRVDAEVGEVVEVRGDAGEVADAVARAVGEGAGIDLVDHGGAPPLRGGAGGGQVGALGEVGRSHPASLPAHCKRLHSASDPGISRESRARVGRCPPSPAPSRSSARSPTIPSRGSSSATSLRCWRMPRPCAP